MAALVCVVSYTTTTLVHSAMREASHALLSRATSLQRYAPGSEPHDRLAPHCRYALQHGVVGHAVCYAWLHLGQVHVVAEAQAGLLVEVADEDAGEGT